MGCEVGAGDPTSGSTVMAKALASTPVGSGGWIRLAAPCASGLNKPAGMGAPLAALALALSRRARETSDVKFYAEAEATLKQSYEISPDNFDGKRIEVWLLLGKHEFAKAREEALKLNQRMPDDVMVYGFLTDANIELGNYEQAEKSAQLNAGPAPRKFSRHHSCLLFTGVVR